MIVKAADCAVEPTSHGHRKRVILRNGALPNVTQAAEGAFGEGASVEPHAHPTMYEVYFILDGRAAYTVGDEEHEVSPGDLVIVPPGVVHGFKVTAAPHRIFYWGIATDR